MRKLLWIVGGVLLAMLVAIASVPLFVNVDKYRPVIVEEANKRLNGKLELGALKLSLWGAIRIHAESIRLSVSGFPEPLVDTKRFHVEIPLLSVLTASPQVIAVLDSPKIAVVRNAAGKMNLLELVKAEGPQAGAASDSLATRSASSGKPPAAAAQPASAPAQVPALLAGARLGLRVEKGDLRYTDALAKSEYRATGLELDARNLGLGSPMEIRLTAPLNGSTPAMTFSGPVSAEALLTPVLASGSVRSVKGKVAIDATKLALELKSKAFRKSASMPLTLEAQFDGDEKETLLRALELRFAGYQVHGKGRVLLEPMGAKIDLSTDPGNIRLDQIETFAPVAAAYQLKGSADLNAEIDWKPEALRVNGNLKVAEGSFFLKEVLQAPMKFRVQAGFSENSVNLARAAVSGPETELELTGSVKNFLAPQFSLALTGKSLNVDKALVLPAAGGGKTTLRFELVPEAHAAAPAPDVNPFLELAKNPAVAGAGGTFTAQVARVTAYGATFERVSARAQLQKLQLRVPEASLRTFGGAVKAEADLDLKSAGLGYRSTGSVAGLSAKEAFAAYFPKYQNTLEGTVDSSWNVSGVLYPAATRLRALKGTAKVAAKDGAVKSVDFQDSINSAMSKVPFLKNQKPVKLDNGFKSMTADLRFDGGTIHAEPVEVRPRSQGFVVKGKSTIRESLEQETFLDVFDPQGQLPKELQQPGKPALQLRITGLITAPKTDYDYTVKRLASTAGKKVLEEQAGKALGKLLGGNKQEGGTNKAEDALRKAADELKKKFKF